MRPEEVALSGLELDALTEVVNIGVSRAAAALRKMVGRQVLLSVPSVEVVDYRKALALLGERETEELLAVRQDFDGPFEGRALLIFPRPNSVQLAREVLGGTHEGDAELEQEALAETGNIILNNCLGTMANILRHQIRLTLPQVLHGNAATLFQLGSGPPGDGMVLFLYINFSVQDRDIRGYIALLMGLQSMGAMKKLVGQFIADVMSDADPADGDPAA
jgi:chemotaxis protein CheC